MPDGSRCGSGHDRHGPLMSVLVQRAPDDQTSSVVLDWDGAIASRPAAGGSLLDAVLATVLDEIAAGREPRACEADGHAADGPASEPGARRGPGAGQPEVLDCGGGSGRRAVPLAVRGAHVTVVDSSIDALAILARRAAEAGVGDRVNGVQADVENLAESAGPGSADLVLVHGVLGATRVPAQVVAAAAAAVRPGGYLSVVVPNPVAAVLARALAGDLDSALEELTASGDSSATRLDLTGLRALAEAAGLEVTLTQGLGAFSSSVPGSVLDGQPGARATLNELDHRAAGLSPYREIAGRLHLLARRPRPSDSAG
jgi:S-adenosylmethionine-dependent methyltransferase